MIRLYLRSRSIFFTVQEECTSFRNRAYEWFGLNELVTNEEHTVHSMFFLKEIRDEDLTWCTRFFGVIVDTCLRWDAHIDWLVRTLSQNVFLLKSMSRKFPSNVLRIAYFSLVQMCGI